MKKSNLLLPLFFCLCLFISLPASVNASLNLPEWDEYFADKLGCTEFAGGILMSGILIFVVSLFILIIVRGKNAIYATMVVDFIFMGFCIAVGWLPAFFLLMVALFSALMLSGRVRTYILGR